MSRSLHRARPQTVAPATSVAMARTNLRVLLSGQGGDAMFAGSRSYYAELVRTHRFGKLLVEAAGGKVEMQPRTDNPEKLTIRASSGRIDLEVRP